MKFIKMYTNLNRKGWVYVNKDKNNMPQGQAEPGKGGKKPGPPKPKNMKKTFWAIGLIF